MTLTFDVSKLQASKPLNRRQANDWFASLPAHVMSDTPKEIIPYSRQKVTGIASRMLNIFFEIVNDSNGFTDDAKMFFNAILTNPSSLQAIQTDSMIWTFDGLVIAGEPFDFSDDSEDFDFFEEFEVEDFEEIEVGADMVEVEEIEEKGADVVEEPKVGKVESKVGWLLSSVNYLANKFM